MAVLGEDGKGYELAVKLEREGTWRKWLGETLYSTFKHSLSSPSSWNSFLSDYFNNLHLILRVRALLFDKASSSLFPNSSSSYLQLHGDDVYFTLEDSKAQSQRFRQKEFPETWYHQFIENYKASRPYMLSSTIRESDKRSPAGMSNYLKLLKRHKRRRVEFKEEDIGGFDSSNSENSVADSVFFPETMFLMNCVPDNVVAPRSSSDGKIKVEFNGVLDTLPKVVTKSSSSIMLERLGIRPEYLSMEQGPGLSHTRVGIDGNKSQVGQEQATQMSKKVVARVLTNVGFEGTTEIPIEVLSQFLSCHISKLGGILKVLADSYRKQCSAIELIKMFLQAGGHSLFSLAEHVKDTRPVLPQTPQQMQNPQSQLVSPQHNTLQLPQQMPRQMHTQIPQMVRPHNLTPQQIEMLRRRQAGAPRAIMNMDKDRAMVEVKLENPPDLPMDSNSLNTRQQAQIWRQHQLVHLQRFGQPMRQPTSMQIPQMQSPSMQIPQMQSPSMQMPQMQSPSMQLPQTPSMQIPQMQSPSMQIPQMQSPSMQIPQMQSPSMQIPQMQSPNIGAVRAQPVKVEGFQELMGGDTSLKQNADENKLTSPSK